MTRQPLPIFDLLGLCSRISKHPDHYACATYYGCNDQWGIMIHQTGNADVIYSYQIVDKDPEPDYGDKTIEQAYSELKEYLP